MHVVQALKDHTSKNKLMMHMLREMVLLAMKSNIVLFIIRLKENTMFHRLSITLSEFQGQILGPMAPTTSNVYSERMAVMVEPAASLVMSSLAPSTQNNYKKIVDSFDQFLKPLDPSLHLRFTNPSHVVLFL